MAAITRTAAYGPAYTANKTSATAAGTVKAENGDISRWSLTNPDSEKEDSVYTAQLQRLLEEAQEQTKALLGQPDNTSGSSNKISSSLPDDSVGQLAALLAKAQTKIDVKLVSSKAERALANLRMALVSSDSKSAKKIKQMIARMKKLLKQIDKKLKNLDKEEQLEEEKKRAEEKMKEKEAEALEKELNSRRTRRRREETNYALKELANDRNAEAGQGLPVSIGSGAPSLYSDSLAATEAESAAASSAAASVPTVTITPAASTASAVFTDASSVGSISLDITI